MGAWSKFYGRAEWERRLKRIPRTMREEVMAANEKSVRLMADQMRAWAPVRTGDLRRSIKVTPPGGEFPPLGIVSRGRVGKMQWGVSVGDEKAWYAPFVEWETKPHMTAGKYVGMHPGTPGQPFFYPTYRLFKRRIKARATRAMKKAIKRS